jgi:hypothetical protein
MQVAYGACCQPAVDEPQDPMTNLSTSGPICTATTEPACETLEYLTAWVKGTPCNGSTTAACSETVKGACCYQMFNATLWKEHPAYPGYCEECHSTSCEADVAWTDCVEANKRKQEDEGGHALKFTTGATCAAGTCPTPWKPVI